MIPEIDILPHVSEVEQAVLGAVLVDNTVWDDVAALLTPDTFFQRRNQIVFQAMQTLRQGGSPIDLISLHAELNKRGQVKEIGGPHYLSVLSAVTPSAGRVAHHARLVVEAALKREVIRTASVMLARAQEPGGDAFELIDYLGAEATRLAERRIGRGGRRFSTIIGDLMQRIDTLASIKPGQILGISTGLYDVDRLIGGFQKGNLYVVAGRPGMGKTAMLVLIAKAAAKGGHGVGIISLEMDDVQLVGRAVADDAGVSAHKLSVGGFDDSDLHNLIGAISGLHDLPIFVNDTPALSLNEIRAEARLMVRRDNVGILLVDYLQLMSEKGQENRAAEISTIARGLKNLAKELQIPVVALAQLNRSVESRPDKRPQLSDLKESGGIEEASDVVAFIHRPEYYGITVDEDNRSTAGMAEILVKKNRHGPTKDIRVRYVADYMRFENLAIGHNLPPYPYNAKDRPF